MPITVSPYQNLFFPPGQYAPSIGMWSIGSVAGVLAASYFALNGFPLMLIAAVILGSQVGQYLWFYYISRDPTYTIQGINLGAAIGAVGGQYLLNGNSALMPVGIILGGWFLGDRLMPQKPMTIGPKPSSGGGNVIPFA